MIHVMSRREFIGKSILGFGALLVSRKSEADLPADKEKIFLNYTEAELDAAYSQREWADNITEVLERLKYRSEAVLAILGEPERCAYGSSPIEGLDWYRTDVPDAPIHVHFHGGAWVVGDAQSSAFVAEPSVLAGAHKGTSLYRYRYLYANATGGVSRRSGYCTGRGSLRWWRHQSRWCATWSTGNTRHVYDDAAYSPCQ